MAITYEENRLKVSPGAMTTFINRPVDAIVECVDKLLVKLEGQGHHMNYISQFIF